MAAVAGTDVLPLGTRVRLRHGPGVVTKVYPAEPTCPVMYEVVYTDGPHKGTAWAGPNPVVQR